MLWTRERSEIDVGASGEATAAPTAKVQGWVREVHGQATNDRTEVRTYLEKAPENLPIEHFRWVKRVLMVSGVVCTLYSVLTEQAPNIVITRICMTLAMLIGWDAFRLIGRVFATVSRCLMAVSLIGWALYATVRVERIGIVCIVFTLVTLILVKCLNSRWLGRETFYRTQRVKDVLSELWPGRVDELWESTGQKEVVALAYDMGAKIVDPIEIEVRHAVWVVGFLAGSGSIKKLTEEHTEIKDEIALTKAELQKATDRLKSVQEYADNLDKYVKDFEALTEQHEHLKELHSSLMFEISARNREIELGRKHRDELDAENAKLKKQVAFLQRAFNDSQAELNSYMEEDTVDSTASEDTVVEQAAPVIEEISTDKLIMDALLVRYKSKRGRYEFCGISKAAQDLGKYGIKRWQVQQFNSDHAKEIEKRRCEILREEEKKRERKAV